MNCPHMFAVNMGEVGEGIVLIEDGRRHVVGDGDGRRDCASGFMSNLRTRDVRILCVK